MRARDHWNAGRYGNYLELYHDDAVLHGYAGVGPGLANIKTFYAGFWAAFGESKLIFEDVLDCGGKVVCRFAVSGKHTGPFQGMPPTQRAFSIPGITILRFEGSKCVERWSQADFLSLLQQLGALVRRLERERANLGESVRRRAMRQAIASPASIARLTSMRLPEIPRWFQVTRVIS